MKIIFLIRKSLYWSCIVLSYTLIAKNGIALNYSGGRLGDNIQSYATARWVAYSRGFEFYYRPFARLDKGKPIELHLSQNLAMHDVLPHYDKHTKKDTVYINDLADLSHQNSDSMFLVHWLPRNNDINWCDYNFIQLLKKEFTPLIPIKKVTLEENHLHVALHVRRGGGFDMPLYQTTAFSTIQFPPEIYNNPRTKFQDRYSPKRFPPDSWYLEMLSFVAEKYPDRAIQAHIFTDDPRPDLFVELYSQKIANKRITFTYNHGENGHDINALEDFLSLMDFDCVIRAHSWFSSLACKIGRVKLEIAPVGYHWKGRELCITKSMLLERLDTGTTLQDTTSYVRSGNHKKTTS